MQSTSARRSILIRRSANRLGWRRRQQKERVPTCRRLAVEVRTMPILDVEVVAQAAPAPGLAPRIADAAAEVLAAPPGKLGVKVRHLAPAMYAENASDAPRPVFVSVLRRVVPGSGAAVEHARLAAA